MTTQAETNQKVTFPDTEEAGSGESGRAPEGGGSAAEGGDGRDYEAEAREMGWVPKEQFHDAPERWVDAQDFVERGEHILPILRANNKKIKKELANRETELNDLRKSLETQKQVLKTLKKHYTESVASEVEAAKSDLIEQLKEAKQSGDIEAEIKVSEALEELKEKQKESKKASALEEVATQPPAGLDPIYVQWQNENSWFGDTNNKENRLKTREVMRIAEDFREEGDKTVGRSFLEKCVQEYESRHSASGRQSKVEAGGRGGFSSPGGRAYDKLSKEAKDACMEDKDMFVGPGKMFKEVKDWQDHFASIYNQE